MKEKIAELLSKLSKMPDQTAEIKKFEFEDIEYIGMQLLYYSFPNMPDIIVLFDDLGSTRPLDSFPEIIINRTYKELKGIED
jgi:hypothetical protein